MLENTSERAFAQSKASMCRALPPRPAFPEQNRCGPQHPHNIPTESPQPSPQIILRIQVKMFFDFKVLNQNMILVIVSSMPSKRRANIITRMFENKVLFELIGYWYIWFVNTIVDSVRLLECSAILLISL